MVQKCFWLVEHHNENFQNEFMKPLKAFRRILFLETLFMFHPVTMNVRASRDGTSSLCQYLEDLIRIPERVFPHIASRIMRDLFSLRFLNNFHNKKRQQRRKEKLFLDFSESVRERGVEVCTRQV